MRCSQSITEREVYNNTSQHQEKRKTSNLKKELTVHLMKLEKEEQQKPKVS